MSEKPSALTQFYADCCWLPAYLMVWALLSWKAVLVLFLAHWLWNIFKSQGQPQGGGK
jgi:hypothetical protein